MAAWVYILANRKNGALYTGVTGDLARRTQEHHSGEVAGHTRSYRIKLLVWYAEFPSMTEAIDYEKRIKKWRRAWRIQLIEEMNPEWQDLRLDLNR